MHNKTKWQWLALTTYVLGFISVLLAALTRNWLFILAPCSLWAIAAWCVAYRPVEGGSNE